MAVADMISTIEAAELAVTTRCTGTSASLEWIVALATAEVH